MNVKTGVQHVIDHAIPLNGNNVTGLTCISNLKIITKEKNEKKSNKTKKYYKN